jgi:hypothetical protein
MSGIRRQSQEEPVPSNAVRAQAADWVARLHDDQPTWRHVFTTGWTNVRTIVARSTG